MHTITADDISHGLALPYAAQALMGKGGSFFVLLMTLYEVSRLFGLSLC